MYLIAIFEKTFCTHSHRSLTQGYLYLLKVPILLFLGLNFGQNINVFSLSISFSLVLAPELNVVHTLQIRDEERVFAKVKIRKYWHQNKQETI